MSTDMVGVHVPADVQWTRSRPRCSVAPWRVPRFVGSLVRWIVGSSWSASSGRGPTAAHRPLWSCSHWALAESRAECSWAGRRSCSAGAHGEGAVQADGVRVCVCECAWVRGCVWWFGSATAGGVWQRACPGSSDGVCSETRMRVRCTMYAKNVGLQGSPAAAGVVGGRVSGAAVQQQMRQ